MFQQLRGGKEIGIQKIGDQHHIRLARTRERELPDVPSLGMSGCPQPAPFFPESAAVGIASRLRGVIGIGVKTDLRMAPNKKMVPSLGKLLESIEVTKAAVRQK